jgi:hypothetical protein
MDQPVTLPAHHGHHRHELTSSIAKGATIMEALESPTAIAMPATVRKPPPGAMGVQLFVSTSLAQWETTARDFQIDDTVYRRLDPEYFAWLRGRMTVAQRGLKAGAIRPEVFDQLRERFNRLQERAIAIFGEPALKEAIRKLAGTRYQPPHVMRLDMRTIPKQSRAPTERARSGGVRDDAEVQAIIAAVGDWALARGWREKRVWGEPGQRNGGTLADALRRPGTRIGQVTRQWIEIIGPPPHENILRLYNPDVEQPWVRAAGIGMGQ